MEKLAALIAPYIPQGRYLFPVLTSLEYEHIRRQNTLSSELDVIAVKSVPGQKCGHKCRGVNGHGRNSVTANSRERQGTAQSRNLCLIIRVMSGSARISDNLTSGHSVSGYAGKGRAGHAWP